MLGSGLHFSHFSSQFPRSWSAVNTSSMWWIYSPGLWLFCGYLVHWLKMLKVLLVAFLSILLSGCGLNIFLHASPLPSRRSLKSTDYYDDGTLIDQLTLTARNGTPIATASVQGGCESYHYGEGIAKEVWIVSCDDDKKDTKEAMDLFPCTETPVCPKDGALARSKCIRLEFDSLTSDAVTQSGIALDLMQRTYESGWKFEAKVSRLSIKKPEGFANALVELNAKQSEGGCSGKKHVEMSGIITDATVDFIVDWESLELDENCTYSGKLWLQNACFERMRSDRLPDLQFLEEPRSQRATRLVRRPWWLLVVGVAAPPIAVALFCSACRWRPRPAVALQSGTSAAKAARPQRRTEVLVAYAGDVSEEVLPLLEALRKRKDIKLLDLHDPRALGKRQEPTVWLARKLLDDSTKSLVVASRGARAVQRLAEAGSRREVRGTGDKNNSCEYPKHLELLANKEEVGEGEGEEEGRGTVERVEGGEEGKGREGGEEGKGRGGEEGKGRDRREKEEEPQNLKIPDSRNGTKDLKGEDGSREERGRREDARNGRRSNEREQVYHFLLVDFLQKMRNEQFDVCQVLMESTPAADLLDDIPKTRVYRWPEHEDLLMSALGA